MNKQRLLYLLPLIIFAGLAVLLFSRNGTDPSFLPSAKLGKPVPTFALPSLNNPDNVLTQDVFKGHVTLLNVWATWCPACLVENPVMLGLQAQGIRIIGINYKDQRDAALAWLAEHGNAFNENIVDAQGSLAVDLGVYGAPETYLVDANGIIRYRAVGVLDERAWREELAPRYHALLQEVSP